MGLRGNRLVNTAGYAVVWIFLSLFPDLFVDLSLCALSLHIHYCGAYLH